MSRAVLLVPLLSLALVAAKPAAPSETAAGRKLLEQAIEAAGGAKALAAINDVTMTGTLTATMGEDDVSGTVTMTESRDGTTRDELSFGGYEMVSVAGPGGGWTSQAGISKTLSGNDLVQAQAQSRFTPLGLLLHGLEPGVVLRALPPAEDHDVLEVDPPGADPLVFQLDRQNHLVTKLTVTSSKDGATLVQRYGLYRAEAGVKFPHQIVIVQAGLSMILSFQDIRVNAGATPAIAKAAPPPSENPVAPPLGPPAPPAAAELSVSVTNRTGKTLNDLHFSVHDRKDWGASLLAVDRFHDGDTATVHPRAAAGTCVFDLMITDVDGHYWIVPGADLCANHALTVRASKSGMTLAPK